MNEKGNLKLSEISNKQMLVVLVGTILFIVFFIVIIIYLIFNYGVWAKTMKKQKEKEPEWVKKQKKFLDDLSKLLGVENWI